MLDIIDSYRNFIDQSPYLKIAFIIAFISFLLIVASFSQRLYVVIKEGKHFWDYIEHVDNEYPVRPNHRQTHEIIVSLLYERTAYADLLRRYKDANSEILPILINLQEKQEGLSEEVLEKIMKYVESTSKVAEDLQNIAGSEKSDKNLIPFKKVS